MITKEQLINEAHCARKSKPSEVQFYKMILSEIERKENDLSKPVVATPEVVMQVIKKLADGVEECLKYKEDASARIELAFYKSFLPKMLSEAEVIDIIQAEATKLNITLKKDKGSLMKALKSIAGIDMQLVNKNIDTILK